MRTTTRKVAALAAGIALLCLCPAPAAAVDREHQQIMADIRMLQEQTQQLQQMLTSLGDALKQLGTRIDDQTGLERKAFADSKVQIDNLSGDVRIVREKVDETTVRLSSLSQEVEALRNALPPPGAFTVPQTSDAGAGAPGSTDPGAIAGAASAAAPPPTPIAGQTPQRLYDAAWADYTMGQYPLAADGFAAFIRYYPRSDMADDAQFYIGESNYNAGKWSDAAAAYARVISDYAGSNQVPNALYKRGMALEHMPGQMEEAKQSYQTAVDKFPDAQAATLSRQRLIALNAPGR